MAWYKEQIWRALLLTGVLAAGAAVPAYAAEEAEAAAETTETAETAEAAAETAETAETEAAQEPETEPMTLEEIQKLVVKNNRLQKTIELNVKKITAGLSAIDDGLSDLKDSQDDAAHARKQASQSASTGQSGLDQIISGAGNLGTVMPGVGDALGGALGGLAQIESGLLSGTVKTASAMEDMVDSIADQQRDTLEDQQTELKNTRQDLNKTQEDWKNEALAVTQLLVTKTVQVEEGIRLLEEKQALLEQLCQIEEKKAELGFSVETDIAAQKLEVSQGEKDLQDARDGLVLLKRQLNDLMGRDLDEALAITPPEMTRTIETAPAYSEELLKTALSKNYTLKTLRRDRQQAKEKSEDMTRYDGEIRASELDMDIADVAIQDQEATVANDLKKSLDRINAAAAEYQNKKDANTKAKTEWKQQQASAKLGMVSPLQLQALQLQYEQTELELTVAAYDYDLAWQEYTMLMDGTALDIYETYQAQLG